MKRFLKNSMLFVLVITLIAIVFDVLISAGLRRTERGHFYTMNKLMNDSINADVVVLGNSRAACSYHPLILDSLLGADTWNIGVSGQPFGVSYLRWQLYQRHNVRPKLLIINMDYAELNMVTNGYEKEQYYPYMRDTLVRPYLDLYGFSWADKHVPLYRYRGDYKLMSIGMMELLGVRHDTKGGFVKGYSNQSHGWEGGNLMLVLGRGKVKDRCNPQVVNLLEGLLEDANQTGIKVVFVYAPLHEKLKDNLEETASRAVYQRLSKEFGVPILDFSGMEIGADTCFFQDANHVNSIGAERFSVELARVLDSLGYSFF